MKNETKWEKSYRGVCLGASFKVHDLYLSSKRKTEMILTSINYFS